ncbi:hypothetical protein DMENIID0001_001840 [Sergentomyia squamirostris]
MLIDGAHIGGWYESLTSPIYHAGESPAIDDARDSPAIDDADIGGWYGSPTSPFYHAGESPAIVSPEPPIEEEIIISSDDDDWESPDPGVPDWYSGSESSIDSLNLGDVSSVLEHDAEWREEEGVESDGEMLEEEEEEDEKMELQEEEEEDEEEDEIEDEEEIITVSDSDSGK